MNLCYADVADTKGTPPGPTGWVVLVSVSVMMTVTLMWLATLTP